MLQESISTLNSKFLCRVSEFIQQSTVVHDDPSTQDTGPLIVVVTPLSTIQAEIKQNMCCLLVNL